MKKLGMMYKVVGVFLIVSIIGALGSIHLFRKIYVNDLVARARSTAQQILIFRKWSASFGGIWTKDKYAKQIGYLLEFDTSNGKFKAYPTEENAEGEELKEIGNSRFFLHNPALATRELSLLSCQENGWSFRVVSDRYMAPQDKPDPWELRSIQRIKQRELQEGEYWSWNGKKFRFAKAIYVKKSCLKCHGTPEQISPIFMKALKAKYGDNVKRAINYKVGDLRGIISIVITPHNLFSTVLSFIDIWIVSAFILTFLAFLGFAILIRKDLIKPIKKLTDAAEAISLGDLDVDLGVGDLKETDVKDEVARLAVAFDRMRSSLKSALRRLREKAKNTN